MTSPLDGLPARPARRRWPPLLLFLLFLPAPCAAQAPAGEARPAIGFAEALEIARQNAPALRAQRAALAGSSAALPAAATLPDPRLAVGLESVPVAGPDRWSATRDTATMQRIALMQDMPNRAKREAREQLALARIERDRTALALAELAVRRDAALAWTAVHYAEARRAAIDGFVRENRLLQETLAPRIAAGSAAPAELTMARQEALAIADRSDDLARDVNKARAELRRWLGPLGDAPLRGEPPPLVVDAEVVRAALSRDAELVPFAPMRAMARADVAEAEAEQRGDWQWELAYSRRPRYDDMVSFQVSFELPWQRDRRQRPLAEARRREIERIDAERDEAQRRRAAEIDAMLAELQALDAQAERLARSAEPLAAERVALALAAYQAGRGDLSAVLAARSQVLETRLRALDLDGQRALLRVRLTTLNLE